MRRTIIAAAAVLAAACGAFAQTVGGKYTVEGRNADGSAYAGTAEIAMGAGGCTITWTTGDTQSKGSCKLDGARFTAAYTLEGAKGRVAYAVKPDGSLDGTWTLDGQDGKGTEVLKPVKAAVAAGGDAASFVRGLYESDPIYNPLADEPVGAKMTGKALKVLKKSEKESIEGEGAGCIDWVLTVNAQDWDDATVRRTLEVKEEPGATGDAAKVTASLIGYEFDGIPADQQTRTVIEYDLRKVDGAWRIADMAARENANSEELWRLSKLCR